MVAPLLSSPGGGNKKAHWDLDDQHLACLLIIDYINQIVTLITGTQLLFIITALDQVST